MVEVLRANGTSKVVFMDLTRDDMAEAVADAFRYGKSSLRQLPMMQGCSLRWKISCTALHIRISRNVLLD